MRIDFSKSELFPQDYTATGGAVILYRRLPNGTCYHAETASPVVGVLERQRTKGGIVRIFYGDIHTGRSWCDEYDMIGQIGRSIGPIKIPLLVPEGECGGAGILDHCIVRVQTRTKILYEHPDFHVGAMEIKRGTQQDLPWDVLVDGAVQARFKLKMNAEHHVAFLMGAIFTPVSEFDLA